MDAGYIASYVFAGVLIACAVLVMFVLVCNATNRHAHQVEGRAFLDITFQERVLHRARLREMESNTNIPVAPEPTANCIACANPDGSLAVARELVVEIKSVV